MDVALDVVISAIGAGADEEADGSLAIGMTTGAGARRSGTAARLRVVPYATATMATATSAMAANATIALRSSPASCASGGGSGAGAPRDEVNAPPDRFTMASAGRAGGGRVVAVAVRVRVARENRTLDSFRAPAGAYSSLLGAAGLAGFMGGQTAGVPHRLARKILQTNG